MHPGIPSREPTTCCWNKLGKKKSTYHQDEAAGFFFFFICHFLVLVGRDLCRFLHVSVVKIIFGHTEIFFTKRALNTALFLAYLFPPAQTASGKNILSAF
jgi:hypothetical protein